MESDYSAHTVLDSDDCWNGYANGGCICLIENIERRKAGTVSYPPVPSMRTRFEVPAALGKKAKWYKYFSLRSLLIGLCMAGIGILIGKLVSKIGLGLYFGIFWALLTIVVTGITMIEIPNTNWMGGGGNTVDIFLIKRFIRKKNRRLYIKGYNQCLYEERRREFLKKKEEVG